MVYKWKFQGGRDREVLSEPLVYWGMEFYRINSKWFACSNSFSAIVTIRKFENIIYHTIKSSDEWIAKKKTKKLYLYP